MQVSSGFLIRTVIVATLLLLPAAAHAQQLSLTAISGRPPKLNFANTTNPDCSSVGDTVVRLTQAPQHGRVTISKTRDFPTFARSNVRFICNTRRVAGTKTVYVSERGYIGTDSAAIEIISASGATARRFYSINVR